MDELNLPTFDVRIKEENKKNFIWDAFRRKYLVLTPEEWVRQHFIHFLVNDLSYPGGRMMIEKEIKYNDLKRRPDLVVYDENRKAILLAEFKAPDVEITEDVFFQIAMYNKKLQVPYLILSNGIDHYCARIDSKEGRLTYLKDVPNYNKLR